MRTKKYAKDLKSGDILFDDKGERIGMLTDDSTRVGWSGALVEYKIMQDDVETTSRDWYYHVYDVQPWTPSLAV